MKVIAWDNKYLFSKDDCVPLYPLPFLLFVCSLDVFHVLKFSVFPAFKFFFCDGTLAFQNANDADVGFLSHALQRPVPMPSSSLLHPAVCNVESADDVCITPDFSSKKSSLGDQRSWSSTSESAGKKSA